MTRKAFSAWRVTWVQGEFTFWVNKIIWARRALQVRKSRGSHYRIRWGFVWTFLGPNAIQRYRKCFESIPLGWVFGKEWSGACTNKIEFFMKFRLFWLKKKLLLLNLYWWVLMLLRCFFMERKLGSYIFRIKSFFTPLTSFLPPFLMWGHLTCFEKLENSQLHKTWHS